jgi:RNA polymerase sigma factor (sigma-70 family)
MRPDGAGNPGSLDLALSHFEAERPRLFGIAYRMLGSAADAEDIVQNVWLKWQQTKRDSVADPPAYLATIAVRLGISALQSAQSQREAYVGPWIPEPVDTTSDPTLGAERGEALELAVLMLLENLAPNERAAYVLREAFEYPFDRIADILGLEVPHVRQLVSRARAHVADGRRRSASADEHKRLLSAFIDAAQRGDATAMESLFASNVVSYADGGGVVRAARIPVSGRAMVATFVAKATARFWGGVSLRWIEANGSAGVVVLRSGVPVTFVTVSASEQGIDQIIWMMRPSKLAAVSRTLHLP